MEGMSEWEYSAHSELSGGTIQKACKASRPNIYDNGEINAAASDVRRANMPDPDERRRSTGGDKRLNSPADDSSCWKARTALTVWQVRPKKFGLQKVDGMLVDRTRAKALVFRLARQDCNLWIIWPARLAALMAAQVEAEMETTSGTPGENRR
jgi:hypothetical protein